MALLLLRKKFAKDFTEKVSLKSQKIRNSFKFFILDFQFSRTLPRKAIPQVNFLVQYFVSSCLCCVRFILLLEDATRIIPVTRKLAFNFWVFHSTTSQVVKNFVKKVVRICYRSGERLFCRNEKCCSWNK